MSEWTLQLLIIPKLLAIAAFAFFYSWGGLNGKWKRRFIAPFILVLTFFILSGYQWISLISYPLLVGSLSLGYGAENTAKKLIKRSSISLAHSVALLPLYIVSQNWVVYGFHCFIILIFSLLFGVVNPVRARDEETAIGLSISLLPLFTI